MIPSDWSPFEHWLSDLEDAIESGIARGEDVSIPMIQVRMMIGRFYGGERSEELWEKYERSERALREAMR